jgi:hypothetical protein
MKTRNSLVSNSSSCSFIIHNNSKKTLTVVDFVKENPQIVEKFKNTYSGYENDPLFNQEEMIKSAERRLNDQSNSRAKILYTIKPGGRAYWTFGDDHGDVIGHVFDYMLRDGGRSENFFWEFAEMNR